MSNGKKKNTRNVQKKFKWSDLKSEKKRKESMKKKSKDKVSDRSTNKTVQKRFLDDDNLELYELKECLDTVSNSLIQFRNNWVERKLDQRNLMQKIIVLEEIRKAANEVRRNVRKMKCCIIIQ